MKSYEIHEPSIKYTIREIEESDIESGGLLEVLENLAPVQGLSKPTAKRLLREIKSNPLHKIFVAVAQDSSKQGLIIGTTTLLVEQKFIFGGGRVGHVEDVSVRSEYRRKNIGFNLVTYATEQAARMGCIKTVLDCSDDNIPFYEKIGYTYQDNCMKVLHGQD
ncbi:MAG TPA: GNAT family N-acetyltransferase [Candidatus Nitrosopolaris sp.]|nr:GNAT family N-acetyltransferase [Candidatus Nitrosopolaris sp.]